MGIHQTILFLILIETLFCVGIYIVSREKGDALFILNEITKEWPSPLRKPIIGCVNCMASVWGTIAQVFYYYLVGRWPEPVEFAMIWVLVTVSVAFTNGLVWALYKYFENYLKHFEAMYGRDTDDTN